MDKNGIFLQLYKRAPAPNRDYYGLTITKSNVILNVWNITHGPHVYPKKYTCPLGDFSTDRTVKPEIEQLFGSHVVDYCDMLSRNDPKLECMPTRVFLFILRHLATNDILNLGQTSKIFFELCNRESSWKLLFKKRCKKRSNFDDSENPDVRSWRNVLMTRVLLEGNSATRRTENSPKAKAIQEKKNVTFNLENRKKEKLDSGSRGKQSGFRKSGCELWDDQDDLKREVRDAFEETLSKIGLFMDGAGNFKKSDAGNSKVFLEGNKKSPDNSGSLKKIHDDLGSLKKFYDDSGSLKKIHDDSGKKIYDDYGNSKKCLDDFGNRNESLDDPRSLKKSFGGTFAEVGNNLKRHENVDETIFNTQKIIPDSRKIQINKKPTENYSSHGISEIRERTFYKQTQEADSELTEVINCYKQTKGANSQLTKVNNPYKQAKPMQEADLELTGVRNSYKEANLQLTGVNNSYKQGKQAQEANLRLTAIKNPYKQAKPMQAADLELTGVGSSYKEANLKLTRVNSYKQVQEANLKLTAIKNPYNKAKHETNSELTEVKNPHKRAVQEKKCDQLTEVKNQKQVKSLKNQNLKSKVAICDTKNPFKISESFYDMKSLNRKLLKPFTISSSGSGVNLNNAKVVNDFKVVANNKSNLVQCGNSVSIINNKDYFVEGVREKNVNLKGRKKVGFLEKFK